jgi:hypothetical protein
MLRPHSLPDELSLKLARLNAHVRKLALLRGTGRLGIVLAVAVGLGLLSDWTWDLNSGTRVGMFTAVCLVVAAALCQWVLRPLWLRMSWAELAAVVERTHPKLKERLTSTVELNDPDVPDAHKGSALMRELLTRQTMKSVAGLDFTNSVSARRSVRAALIGAAAVLLLILPFLVAPAAYGLLWSRLMVPWGNFDSAGNLFFHVEDGNRFVARGSDVTIKAEPRWHQAAGELPQAVRLNWTDLNGERDSRRMEFGEKDAAFITTIPHVFNTFDFNISAVGGRSRKYRIHVVDAPEITGFTLDVEPPDYTGMPAVKHDGVVGELPVFEQSRLRFELQFNKPLSQAEFVWLAGTVVSDVSEKNVDSSNDHRESPARIRRQADRPQADRLQFKLSPDGRAATLEMIATTGGPFEIRLTDEHGLHNSAEPQRILVLGRDEPPELTVAGSSRPQQVRPNDVVVVDVEVSDDVGVGDLELHYTLLGGAQGVLPLEQARLGGRSISHEFQIDLADLKVTESSMVTYRIRAADERPVPAPNEVWSEPRVLTIDRNAKPVGSEDVAQRQQKLRKRLEGIRDDLTKNREQVSDLQKQATADLLKKQKFERNEELQPASRKQLELALQLESLAAKFAEHPLFANLTKDTQQVAREDLTKSSRNIKRAVEALLPEKADALQQNVEQLAVAENKLREVEKRFDKLAAIERDLLELNRLAQQAERLAEETLALAHSRQNPPADETPEQKQIRERELAARQQELPEQQQELAAQLNELLERRPELLAAARKSQLDRLANLAQRALDLAEPQDLLAEALRREAQQTADKLETPAKQQQPPLQEKIAALQQTADLQKKNEPQKKNAGNAKAANRQQGPQNPSDAEQKQIGARQAQAQQQQLARESAELALDVARQNGPKSPSAQEAANSARLCSG